MVHKIRVILNTKEDVIRDIAIDSSSSLEELHNAITNSFVFTGEEMASFYRSDETWVQGEEHPLFDMGEGLEQKTQMNDIVINDVLQHENDRLIYVYDFFNMWSFYVELIQTNFEQESAELPSLLFSLGVIPDSAPDIQFESEDLSVDDFEDDQSEEFDDEYGDFSYN